MARILRQRINPLVNSGRTSPLVQRIARKVYIAMAKRVGDEEEPPPPEPEVISSVFLPSGAGPAGT